MSGDSGDDRVSDGGSSGTSDTSRVSAIEHELEELADRIASTIDSSPAADRESLHDYAVSLVRERLPVADRAGAIEGAAGEGSSPAGTSSGGSGGASALVYGVLLFLVGPFLFLVFPPVGLMLLLSGVLMIGWGLVALLVGRLRAGA